MFPNYKVRVFANACITRFERGEKQIQTVLDSYNLTEENATLVKNQITSMRADIDWTV